MDMHMIMCQVR